MWIKIADDIDIKELDSLNEEFYKKWKHVIDEVFIGTDEDLAKQLTVKREVKNNE